MSLPRANIQRSNEKTEDFILYVGDSIRRIKTVYDKFKEAYYVKTPLQLKIANILVPFILTYYFTVINYRLYLSLIFAFITYFTMGLLNLLLANIFVVFYLITLYDVSNKTSKILGNPILQTDIVQNGLPFNCLNNGLTVDKDLIVKELNGGSFTYSFWIYINGNNNDLNTQNWNSYRFNEWKSVFYRGNPIPDDGDLTNLTQFPGVWLTPVTNNMVIVFQNSSNIERIEINNLEFNKWINFIFVVDVKSVSIYIDGMLDRSVNISQNPNIMNSYNLYVSSDKNTNTHKNSGFAGNIAELIFYNKSLGGIEINKLYNYYKKIIDNYQNNIIIKKYTYTANRLINNDSTL